MKNKLLYILCLLIFHFQGQAQCDVNYQETIDSYCSGDYLIHYELSNEDLSGVMFILEKGNPYSIYLLNPNHPFSKYKFYIDSVDLTEEFLVIENDEAIRYNIIPEETREYHISLETSTDDKACVLLAILLQADSDTMIETGIYRSIEELKYNSPAEEFNYTLKQKKAGRNKGKKYYTYRLIMDRDTRVRIGQIYGFFDGNELYMNLHAKPRTLRKSTDFVMAERIGMFYYLEYFQSVYYTTGKYGGWVHNSIIQKVIHKDSGEVINLSKSSIRKLIQDDAELLEEFEQESRKSEKLKEYFLKYINRNYSE